MYALRFIRENKVVLLACVLAYTMAVSCRKEDDLAIGTATTMQVVPVNDTLPAVITQPTLLTNTHPWFIKDWLYVGNNASLTLESGTQVYALPSNEKAAAGVIITRGSKLVARGSEQFPVTFHLGGKGSGVIMLGNAPAGKQGLYDKMNWPAGQKLSYGGTQAADSSGSLQNVEIFYNSSHVNSNSFPGGLLLLGVGSHTQLKNIKVYQRPEAIALGARKLK